MNDSQNRDMVFCKRDIKYPPEGVKGGKNEEIWVDPPGTGSHPEDILSPTGGVISKGSPQSDTLSSGIADDPGI
jgi:hypothetical protein